MQFPFDPSAPRPPGRFLIQDPSYRARILPLFNFDHATVERRVVGQGSVFRIDPWGNCATAFHVFEDAFYLGGTTGREMMVRQGQSILALEIEGLGFGRLPIAPHQWRNMNGSYSVVKIDQQPFQAPRLQNFTELLALSIPSSTPKPGGTEFLDVDLNSWKPTIGEVVLGIGYPNLDQQADGPDDRPISQYMYGAYGCITDIERLDLGRSRPWPMIRVNADWPGGMSGGPVFNAAGNVVGVISSGVDATTSTAMFFGGWNAVSHTFGSVDPGNPGWFLCFAILDANERLIDVALNRQTADEIAAKNEGAFVSRVSLNHANGGFVRHEL